MLTIDAPKSEIRSTKSETNRRQINPKRMKIQNAESGLKLFENFCFFEHSNLFRVSCFGPRGFFRASNFSLFASLRPFDFAQDMLCGRYFLVSAFYFRYNCSIKPLFSISLKKLASTKSAGDIVFDFASLSRSSTACSAFSLGAGKRSNRSACSS